jgi:hypothetical protein
MENEVALLRQAHEEQAKRVVAERVVAADRIRMLELRAEQLERRAADVEREAADVYEVARRDVEVARAERDAAVRQLEELRQTRTYRLLTQVSRLLPRGAGHSR